MGQDVAQAAQRENGMTAWTPSRQPRALRWLAWLPLVICLAGYLLLAILMNTVCAPAFPGELRWGWVPTFISSVGFGALCGLIVAQQPDNRIGWLCGALAALSAVVMSPVYLLQCGQQDYINLTGYPLLGLTTNLLGLYISLQFILLPLWFPNGRFLSAGWRRFAQVTYGLLFLGVLLAMIWPGELLFLAAMAMESYENPLQLPFQPPPMLTIWIQRFLTISLLGGVLIANFSLFARWRQSAGQVRHQLKIFAFFLVTVGTVYMLFEMAGQLLYPDPDLFSLWDGNLYLVLNLLLWGGFPLSIGAAILRYRLYDIDLIIRRTLVYTTLTGMLALVYFGSVVVLQALFTGLMGQQSTVAIVLSTLGIAALFTPLRSRLQGFIDRRFYRRKYDAEQVLAAFAQQAQQETDLEALITHVADIVQHTMQPEHTSLWLRHRRDHAEESG
jgi:hypothetical protein